MDVMTILFIVFVIAIIGTVIIFFILSQKKKNHSMLLQLQAEKAEKLKTKNESESLLSESKSQIVQLDDVDKLKKTIKDLQEEIEKNKDDLDRYKKKLKKNGEESITPEKAEKLKTKNESESLLSESKSQIVQLDDVDKLKKIIKDLQEEIENKENDLDCYKKKLKKNGEENITLQDLLDKENRESKLLKADFELLKSELEDKTDELNLKMESLYFVQEVLSAKQVSDADTKELYNKVDNVCNFVGGELFDCVKRIFDLKGEKDLFDTNLNKWAITAKKRWIQGKTTIAFVGEFSAGKTSIVNRILSQDNPDIPLLPVSTKATTAIPTYISGGPSTYYNFVTPDNIQKNISPETFKRVNKEVLDQTKGVSSLIQYFVMTYKNDNLRNLSILDTPGFNSNDKEDAERTLGVINECDALFWVVDINAGNVNRSSIALIKENLKKTLYVVINKVDTKAETEVSKVEQLIRKTFRDEGVDVKQIIRFSAKLPLEDIMSSIKSITHDNAQDSYINNLSSYINQLVEVLSNEEKEANKQQIQLFIDCENLVAKYEHAMKELVTNCQTVAEIPHHEPHLFSKDKYEMSVDEYYRLSGMLDIICENRVHELIHLYNEQMDTQEKALNAYSNYFSKKDNWRDMNNCKEQLDRLIKNFKTTVL